MDNAVLWDADANPVGIPMHQLVYDLRIADAGVNLLLDSTTMADLMTDPDIEAVVTLDALVVEVSRMSLKMDMLKKVMEMAGGAVKPTEVTISDPVRARGVLQVMVLFQMDDGQTISIWFHNPDTTPAKLMPLDELISWKWMLNKKDVTIVVAPERGQELNVREVARRVMKLVERNSAAFARANAKAAERVQQVEGLKNEVTVLELELSDWQRKIEVAQMERDEAPTPKERWDSARGHAQAVNKQVREELVGGTMPQDPTALAAITGMLTSLRNLATGAAEAATPEALRSQVDELAVSIRAKAEEAAKIAPAPTAAPETPAVVADAQGDAALAALVTPDDIFGIRNDGGYSAVIADERLSLKWQDVLDSAMQQRLVDVRNALRQIGWVGTGLTLSKHFGDSVYSISHDAKRVGGGGNIVAITWVLNAAMREDDDLTLKAPDMAAKLDGEMAEVASGMQAQGLEAKPVEAVPLSVAAADAPLSYDPSVNRYNGEKLMPGDYLRDEAGATYRLDRANGFILTVDRIGGNGAPAGIESFSVDATDTAMYRKVWRTDSMDVKVAKASALGASEFAAGAKRVPALSTALAELLKGTGNHAAEVIAAWVKAWDRANIAAAVPESAGPALIVVAAGGRWRVASAKNDNPISPSYPTEAEAQAAADAAMAAGNLAFPQPSDDEGRAAAQAAQSALPKSPTDAELEAAAEAGAEVRKVARNLADPKTKDMVPRAHLSTEDGKVSIALWTDSDVSRAVKAVHDAEDISHFKPFDASTLKMPTPAQLGLTKAYTPLLIVSDDDNKVVLDGWSNGHVLDLVGRPPVVQKALEKYAGDFATTGFVRRVPMSKVERLEAAAKSRHTQVEPISSYDFEQTVVDAKTAAKKGRYDRVQVNSVVMESADGSAWVWLDQRYVAYFWKTYKGCTFFAGGPDESVAVRQHGKLVGIVMPRNAQGDTTILLRAKRAKAKIEAAKEPDALTPAAVDAAYVFADATDAFKIAVAHSVADTDYSAFASARNIDERAKALGLSVSWDVQSVVLDGVVGFDADAALALVDTPRERVLDALVIAARPYLPAGAVLDFAGDVSAAIAQLEVALDVCATNEPINRERGAIEQADLERDNAAQFRNAIHVLKAGAQVLDDAGAAGGEEWETVVGTIKRGGDVIGRAVVMDGDGKSMIFLGAAGTQRVTYVSPVDGERRSAMWSGDDAGDMVDWLVENIAQAQEQAQAAIAAAAAPASEPETVATGGGQPPEEPPVTPPVADEPSSATPEEGRAALKQIAHFMPTAQRRVIESGMRGEEAQFFYDKMVEMRDLIVAMPKTYDTDGQGGAAVAQLHYFIGSGDWYITERDREFDEQAQAFGMADLGHGPELGYISIEEITQAGAELDLHWSPKTIGEIRGDDAADDEEAAQAKRDAEEIQKLAAEQRAREDADKDPIPELIAAGFTRIGAKGQEYGKSVDSGGNAVMRFNVRRVGAGGYPAGWKVTMSVTFKNGITGAPSQDLGLFDTPAQAVAAVAAKAPTAEEQQATMRANREAQTNIDILNALVANHGWEGQPGNGPLKKVIGGGLVTANNPNGDRRLSANLWQGDLYATHGDNQLVSVKIDYTKDAAATAAEFDAQVMALPARSSGKAAPAPSPTGENAPMNALRPLTPQAPDRIKWEGEVARIMSEQLEVTNGDAQGMMEARPDDLDAAFAAGEAPASVVARLWPAEAAPDVMEQYIKIAADSIAELRKVDVDRVLGSVRSDNIDGVTRESLAAWITQKRPDLASEVSDVMAELAPPAAAPAADPDKAADRAYLQTLIDGSADYFDAGILDRIEPMFTKYATDTEMMDVLTRAADAYSNAATAAAKQALGG